MANGDFSSTDLSDWSSAIGSTATVTNGEFVVTGTSASGRQVASITTVVGKIYTLTGEARVSTGSGTALLAISDSTSGLAERGFVATSETSADNLQLVFVATQSTHYITAGNGSSGTGDKIFDNISVKEVTFDQPDGTLTLFEHPENVPRVEYDADGNRLGLLVEESRTNLVTHSQDFDDSSWDKFYLSISANTATAPDGTVTADTLSEDTSSNYRYLGAHLGAVSADWTFSAFVKKKDDNIQIQLRPLGVGGGKAFATFDPADGSLLYSGGTNLVSTSTTNVGNGWHRISMTVDLALTDANHGVLLALVAGQSTELPSYTGTGKGVYVWGAQVEASSSFPTSYIKTTGSTATRSADVASIPVADFGYNQSAGSVFFEVINNNSGTCGALGDGTFANDLRFGLDGSNIARGTGSGFANTVSTGSYTGQSKFAVGIELDNYSSAADGVGAGVNDTSASLPPNPVNLYIGQDYGAQLNGHIKSIKYYPRRLTNAQLQDITS